MPARFLATVTHFRHFSSCKNLPEKRARSIFDDSYTLLALFELQKCDRKVRPLDFGSLVPGPWSLVPGSMVPGPWSLGPRYHLVGFRNIVSSWMRCFRGLASTQRYRPDQQLEIYNFRVVPGLQMSKEVDFQWFICVFLIKLIKVHCFVTNEVPFKFQEELMVRFEPLKRNLQF